MLAASTSVPVQVLIFVAIAGCVANLISSIASAVMAWVNVRRLKAVHETVSRIDLRQSALSGEGSKLERPASGTGRNETGAP